MAVRGPRAVFLVTMDLISVFLFSGPIFGWAAFNSMLVHEGYYKRLCSPDHDPRTPCDAQLAALNRAFTVASTVVSVAALPGGWFVDKFGPAVGVALAGTLNVIGLAGIALSETLYDALDGKLDIFLFSLVTQAIGGSMAMFCGYQAPFLFPARSTLLIEVTSCLFDASSIIFPVFRLLYGAGVGLPALFWLYTGTAAATFVLLFAAWCGCMPALKEIRSLAGQEPADGSAGTLAAHPVNEQLRTIEFCAIFVFSVVQIPRSNLYMGSVDMVNGQIAEQSGETSGVSLVSAIIGLAIPFGFLAVPAIEASIHGLGIIGTVQLTTVMGWMYACLQLVPELYVQLAVVIIFAAWRAFLFSIMSAYNAHIFGPRSMGRIMGVSFLFSGIANLVQSPLVNLSLHGLNGDVMPMLIGCLLVSAPLPILFWAVQKKHRRATVAAEPAELQTPFSGNQSFISTFVSNISDKEGSTPRTRSRVFSHSTAAGSVDPHILQAAIERAHEQGATDGHELGTH